MPALLTAVLSWLVKSVLVKFMILFALFFVVKEFLPFLISLLPLNTNLDDLFNLLPDPVWFFLNYFLVTDGLSLVLSALLTRFIIRRIPLIG